MTAKFERSYAETTKELAALAKKIEELSNGNASRTSRSGFMGAFDA